MICSGSLLYRRLGGGGLSMVAVPNSKAHGTGTKAQTQDRYRRFHCLNSSAECPQSRQAATLPLSTGVRSTLVPGTQAQHGFTSAESGWHVERQLRCAIQHQLAGSNW